MCFAKVPLALVVLYVMSAVAAFADPSSDKVRAFDQNASHRFAVTTDGRLFAMPAQPAGGAQWQLIGNCDGESLVATDKHLFTITESTRKFWVRPANAESASWKELGHNDGAGLVHANGTLFTVTLETRKLWARPATDDASPWKEVDHCDGLGLSSTGRTLTCVTRDAGTLVEWERPATLDRIGWTKLKRPRRYEWLNSPRLPEVPLAGTDEQLPKELSLGDLQEGQLTRVSDELTAEEAVAQANERMKEYSKRLEGLRETGQFLERAGGSLNEELEGRLKVKEERDRIANDGDGAHQRADQLLQDWAKDLADAAKESGKRVKNPLPPLHPVEVQRVLRTGQKVSDAGRKAIEAHGEKVGWIEANVVRAIGDENDREINKLREKKASVEKQRRDVAIETEQVKKQVRAEHKQAFQRIHQDERRLRNDESRKVTRGAERRESYDSPDSGRIEPTIKERIERSEAALGGTRFERSGGASKGR